MNYDQLSATERAEVNTSISQIAQNAATLPDDEFARFIVSIPSVNDALRTAQNESWFQGNYDIIGGYVQTTPAPVLTDQTRQRLDYDIWAKQQDLAKALYEGDAERAKDLQYQLNQLTEDRRQFDIEASGYIQGQNGPQATLNRQQIEAEIEDARNRTRIYEEQGNEELARLERERLDALQQQLFNQQRDVAALASNPRNLVQSLMMGGGGSTNLPSGQTMTPGQTGAFLNETPLVRSLMETPTGVGGGGGAGDERRYGGGWAFNPATGTYENREPGMGQRELELARARNGIGMAGTGSGRMYAGGSPSFNEGTGQPGDQGQRMYAADIDAQGRPRSDPLFQPGPDLRQGWGQQRPAVESSYPADPNANIGAAGLVPQGSGWRNPDFPFVSGRHIGARAGQTTYAPGTDEREMINALASFSGQGSGSFWQDWEQARSQGQRAAPTRRR